MEILKCFLPPYLHRWILKPRLAAGHDTQLFLYNSNALSASRWFHHMLVVSISRIVVVR